MPITLNDSSEQLGLLPSAPLTANASLIDMPITREQYEAQMVACSPDFLANVAALGVLTPIAVMDCGPGNPYRVVAGRRRLTAAIAAGFPTIPALLLPSHLSVTATAAATLTENLHRRANERTDFAALREMVRRGIPMEQIAAELRVSLAVLRRRLRLLNLIGPLQEAFLAGHVTVAQAEVLARLPVGRQMAIHTVAEDVGEMLSLAALREIAREAGVLPSRTNASQMEMNPITEHALAPAAPHAPDGTSVDVAVEVLARPAFSVVEHDRLMAAVSSFLDETAYVRTAEGRLEAMRPGLYVLRDTRSWRSLVRVTEESGEFEDDGGRHWVRREVMDRALADAVRPEPRRRRAAPAPAAPAPDAPPSWERVAAYMTMAVEAIPADAEQGADDLFRAIRVVEAAVRRAAEGGTR